MYDIQQTILGVILQLSLFLWFLAFFFAVVFKQHTQYLKWTGNSIKTVWKAHWKFIIGIIVGVLLSFHGSLNLSMH